MAALNGPGFNANGYCAKFAPAFLKGNHVDVIFNDDGFEPVDASVHVGGNTRQVLGFLSGESETIYANANITRQHLNLVSYLVRELWDSRAAPLPIFSNDNMNSQLCSWDCGQEKATSHSFLCA